MRLATEVILISESSSSFSSRCQCRTRSRGQVDPFDDHVGSTAEHPEPMPPDPELTRGVGRHLDHDCRRHPGQHQAVTPTTEPGGRHPSDHPNRRRGNPVHQGRQMTGRMP
jgi:hypothetical protein